MWQQPAQREIRSEIQLFLSNIMFYSQTSLLFFSSASHLHFPLHPSVPDARKRSRSSQAWRVKIAFFYWLIGVANYCERKEYLVCNINCSTLTIENLAVVSFFRETKYISQLISDKHIQGKIFSRLFYFMNGEEWRMEGNTNAENFAVCVISITAK